MSKVSQSRRSSRSHRSEGPQGDRHPRRPLSTASLGGAVGLGSANGARTASRSGAALDDAQSRTLGGFYAAVFTQERAPAVGRSFAAGHGFAGSARAEGCFDDSGGSPGAMTAMIDGGSGESWGVCAF